jgi:multisubunit Na+/H+ antiporter MnhB subunit
MNTVKAIILVVLLGAGLGVSLDIEEQTGHNETARYYITKGRAETGAVNIVTSIYLGYRAYDTLGEAMALFTAATGVFLLLKRKGEVKDEHL